MAVHSEKDVATFSTITTIRSTVGNELLLEEMDHSISAFS